VTQVAGVGDGAASSTTEGPDRTISAETRQDPEVNSRKRPRKGSEVRQRTELIGLRLLPGERQALEAEAIARNMSLAELIRTIALGALGKD
jgi:hypothetical protein